jgi:RNA polymerase-binding transcription factor
MFGGARRRASTVPDSLVRECPSYSFPSFACGGIVAVPNRPQVSGSAESAGALPGTKVRATVRRAMPTKKSPYTKKELSDLRERLEQERVELQRQASEIEESSFRTPQSELSGEVSFDEEYADAGTATFERERDLSLTNNIKDLTEKIDRALDRIVQGTYGLCERCGRPIEKARIKALPYATLCIKDKQAEERAG